MCRSSAFEWLEWYSGHAPCFHSMSIPHFGLCLFCLCEHGSQSTEQLNVYPDSFCLNKRQYLCEGWILVAIAATITSSSTLTSCIGADAMQKLPTKYPLIPTKVQCSILSVTVATSDKGAACNLIREHHTYNSLTDNWVKDATRPQPFINITFGISQVDYYTSLGHPLSVVPKSATTSVMADT